MLSLWHESDEATAYDKVLAGLRQSQLRLVGPELIYGTLFDRIGYSKVTTANNALFRALVVTRLYHPGSKLRTAEYMERFMHKSYSPDSIYRFLDELCVRKSTAEQVREATDEGIGVKWQVEQVAFDHTKAVIISSRIMQVSPGTNFAVLIWAERLRIMLSTSFES